MNRDVNDGAQPETRDRGDAVRAGAMKAIGKQRGHVVAEPAPKWPGKREQ